MDRVPVEQPMRGATPQSYWLAFEAVARLHLLQETFTSKADPDNGTLRVLVIKWVLVSSSSPEDPSVRVHVLDEVEIFYSVFQHVLLQ